MASNDCISTHTAYIYDRGGMRRIAQLKDISYLSWSRLRDDKSEATVRIEGATNCMTQADVLDEINPMRHELVIYRNNERVWEGPIGRISLSASKVEIFAEDVMLYAERTVARNEYNSNAKPGFSETVVARAAEILRTELARKEALDPPINVLPHLVEHHFPNEARTAARTLANQYTVFEHVDNMAMRNGMDYVVVGRAIHLFDTSRPIGQTRTTTEADYLGELVVTKYGKELATHVTVTDGQGNAGSVGAVDPFYGEIELLVTAFDEDSGEEPPTVAAMQSQASRNLAGRNPVPVQVRVPDNSSININGVLSIDDLVPGTFIPVRIVNGPAKVSQMQKLKSMRVQEDPKGENISVVLFPASSSDEDEEED